MPDSSTPGALERSPAAGETAGHDGRIQILEDASGAVVIGPVSENVIYVCFIDRVSLALAAMCARRLRRILEQPGPFALFVDAHDPDTIDLGARNEIVRCLFAHRSKLSLVVSLVRTPAVGAVAALISRVLETADRVTDDSSEFDHLLSALAPQAHDKLDPANCVCASASEHAKIRLLGSC
jgi:hypothetical protein